VYIEQSLSLNIGSQLKKYGCYVVDWILKHLFELNKLHFSDWMSRSGNSVLNCCVFKAERTFQVVNLFHSYDLPVSK